jgi:VWFA-related protein
VTTVQVDAVVTDRDGRQVTDLRPEDFEIEQDGRKQTISTFAYFAEAGGAVPTSTAAAATAPVTAPAPGGVPSVGAPAATPATAESGRTLVIVFDDLSLSMASVLRAKQALHKIIDTQLAPGDRVSLVRTASGSSRLQQFTEDKAVLHQLVDRLRFNSRQFERDDWQLESQKRELRGWPPIEEDKVGDPPVDVDASPVTSGWNQDNVLAARAFGTGTIGTLQTVVAGLRPLPGRKGIILLSDGFALTGTRGGPIEPRLEQALHGLADQATRARTVIYSINVRPWEFMNSADADLGADPFKMNQTGLKLSDVRDQARADYFFGLMEGPSYLASQTGGFFFRNPSDLGMVLRRSIEDQRGYYLIGYSPDQQTVNEDRRGRMFHKLEVRVKKGGLSVRSRRGFLGGPDRSAPSDLTTTAFGTSNIDLQLTGFFAGRQEKASVIRALVYIDASALEFHNVGRSERGAAFLELIALVTDEEGAVVKRDRQTYRLRSREDARADGGMVYQLDVPIEKPGAYNLRVAARDALTNRFGWANQFVLVPDLDRKKLALSGVLLSASEGDADLTSGTASSAHPAVRRFSMPARLAYAFQAFNARDAKDTGRPSLQMVVRLLRDGKTVYQGKPVDLPTDARNGAPVSAVGTLSLGTQTAPGEYTLSVTVADLAAAKLATATSVIDFTIDKR